MPKLTNKEKIQHKKFLDAENRRDKFIRLANRRVNRILTGIRLIGNLASSNYQWNKDDIRQIRSAIDKTMDVTLVKFEVRDKDKGVADFALVRTIRGREVDEIVEKAVTGTPHRPAPQRSLPDPMVARVVPKKRRARVELARPFLQDA